MRNSTRASGKLEEDSGKLKEEDRNPSNTRKSERIGIRLDSRVPVIHLVKRKRVEKESTPSPLRRSRRGAKHMKCQPLSSSSSDTRKKKVNAEKNRRKEEMENKPLSSTSSDTRKKKVNEEKNRRKEEMENRKRSKGKKTEEESTAGMVLRNKRLDARSYRASFKLQPRKKVKQSDLAEKHCRLDNLTPGDSINTGNCSGRKGDKPREEYSGEGVEKSVESSGSGSRKVTDSPSEGDGLSRLSRKRKFCTGEPSEMKCRGISQIPNLGDSLIQSSPDGSTAKTHDDDGESEMDCSGKRGLQTNINDCAKIEVGCSRRVELPPPESIPSTSSEVKESSSTPETSSADDILTSPFISKSHKLSKRFIQKNKLTKRCDTCFKQQRVSCDSQNREVCSCIARKCSDLCDIELSKGAPMEVDMLGSPRTDVIVDSCFLKDAHEENLGLDVTQQSTEAQKASVHGITLSSSTTHILVPVEKDRGKLEVNGNEVVDEECANGTETKKSSLDIGTDSDLKFCVICKLGGELLCCDGKGCRRSYHLSCVDPPLNSVPYGAWHCLHCVKKKMKFGVHSVCKGLESIWDAREVEVSGSFGIRKEKQYLVKYKGLAHVHNHWISEKKLLQQDALLVSKFNRKHQKEKVVRWKFEWTVPQRVLQKRLLMSQRQADEYFGRHCNDSPSCLYEWFVKWNGLGYDHATWELENTSFLSSPEGKVLIRDYESRHEKAKKASDPQRADKERESSFLNLQKLPSGFSGVNNDSLNSVNKLCDCWSKHQSVVIIDDQERILKVILFILSLRPYVCRPFLVVSTSSALSVWENELLHLAPSANVVVYNGEKDVRKCIQMLEFYEEGGCVMFEVLVSSPDAVIKDFEQLICIGWEAIIIDECQHSRVSRYLNQIVKLTSEFRLLLYNGPMKDNVPEYLNLLSFLDPVGDGTCVDSLNIDSSDTVDALPVLKERLAKFIAYERKSDSSKFVEYWVPIQLSKVQLEQYCATLLSNFISLRSCSKNDPVGALRDILISLRKCCDHPYLVGGSLQTTVANGLPETEYLDVGVNASGKLQLLDKILIEIKNRGLRVLILFQSSAGSGPISIGDILDDFLRQRFGPDCYERVDVGLLSSKKQAALNMFNDKDRGRFVFLIENRACLPSIKLSSVDTIIIFGSDWNPFNDLRSLQKIYIESQFQQLKVFRFYSFCTVEEKVLILAKQDVPLESNLRNINRSTNNILLTWGASYLFNKLDEFHGGTIPTSGSSTSDLSLLDDVVSDLLTKLPHGSDTNNINNCSVISEVQQTGTVYPKNVSLLGELEMQLTEEEPPHLFWSKLLEGRYPLWRYLSGSSQRSRKKVQHFDEILKVPEAQNNEARRKRKKVANTTVGPVTPKTWLEDKRKVVASEGEARTPDSAMITRGSSGSSLPCSKESPVFSLQVNKESGEHETKMIQPDGRRKLFDAQKSLHLLLKSAISQLCETLQLPEDVRYMVGNFLEYVMHNLRVSREPETILQAFQISLCWLAASFLKHKLDRKKSLVLAKQHLNFMCKDEEVELVYSRLRPLKKTFSPATGALQNTSQGHSTVPRNDDVARCLMLSNQKELGEMSSPQRCSFSKQVSVDQEPDLMQAKSFKLSSSNRQELEEGEIRECSHSHNLSDVQVSMEQEAAPDSKATNSRVVKHDGVVAPCAHSNENVSQNVEAFNRSIKRIQKVYAQRRRMILTKQHEDFQEFMNFWNREKEKLKKAQRLEADLISTIHDNASVKLDKLKKNDEYFTRKMDELETNMETIQREIMAKQQDARNQEKRIRKGWLDAAENGKLPESFADLPLTESAFKLEIMMTDEQNGVYSVPENVKLLPESSSEPGNATITKPVVLTVHGEMSTECPEMIPNEVPDGIYTETVSPVIHSIAINAMSCENDGMGNATSEQNQLLMSPGEGIECMQSCGGRQDCPPQIEVSLLQPITTSLQLEKSNDDLTCHSIVQLKLHSSTDGLSCEHNQLDASAAAQNNDEADLQLQVPSLLTDDPPVECYQPVTSAATEGESEPVQQLQLISDVPSVECCQPVRSATEGEFEPVQQLQLISDVPSVECSQPVTSAAEGESEPVQQLQLISDVPFVQCSQPVTSATEGETEPVQQIQLISDVPSVECSQPVTSTATVTEPVAVIHLQLPTSTDVPSLRPNQLDTSAVTERGTDPVMQLELPPSTDALPAECNQLDTSSIALRSEPESRSERCSSSQPTVVTQQNIEAIPSRLQQSNNLVSESNVQLTMPMSTDGPSGGMPMGDTGRARMLPELNNPTPMTTRQPPPQFSDPLKNELAKLRFQEEQLIKMHEDEKTRFSSDCEKEIEEVRRKYNTLIEDAEKEFMEMKKMLEVYWSKVNLNMFLAEAFKIKCTDAKPGSQPSRPGISSTATQQFPVQSLPQTAHRPPRPPAPPVQVVHHSAALFSSNPLAPSAVNPASMVIPRVNLQSGSGLRAPPPHLQPFRPSMSVPLHSPPLGGGIPRQAALNQHTTAQPLPLQLRPQVPFYHPSGAFTGTQLPVSSGTFPAVYNPSSLELLMDVGNRSRANLLRPLSESNFDTWLPSSQTMVSSGRGSTVMDVVAPVAATDVVCLSDDE